MHETSIKFYATTQAYGEFSNFAQFPIQLKGKTWKTSEHYFQAQKFSDKAYQEKIRKAPTAMQAAQLGRSRKVKMIKNWDNRRDNVMYKVLKAKFTQHEDLRQLLLETGDKILIEHTENDSYWGDSGDGSGKNRLGKLLMRLRKELG